MNDIVRRGWALYWGAVGAHLVAAATPTQSIYIMLRMLSNLTVSAWRGPPCDIDDAWCELKPICSSDISSLTNACHLHGWELYRYKCGYCYAPIAMHTKGGLVLFYRI